MAMAGIGTSTTIAFPAAACRSNRSNGLERTTVRCPGRPVFGVDHAADRTQGARVGWMMRPAGGDLLLAP